MKETRKRIEQFHDLAWFIKLLRHGFEHLANVRGYSDIQFKNLETALNELEPVPDDLDDLLMSLSVLPEEDSDTARPLPCI